MKNKSIQSKEGNLRAGGSAVGFSTEKNDTNEKKITKIINGKKAKGLKTGGSHAGFFAANKDIDEKNLEKIKTRRIRETEKNTSIEKGTDQQAGESSVEFFTEKNEIKGGEIRKKE